MRSSKRLTRLGSLMAVIGLVAGACSTAQPGSQGADEPVLFSAKYLSLEDGERYTVVDGGEYGPADEADFMRPEDVVLGLVVGDTAIAFPVALMGYHHIANLEIAGEPYVVTY